MSELAALAIVTAARSDAVWCVPESRAQWMRAVLLVVIALLIAAALLVGWPTKEQREFREWKRLRDAERSIDDALRWGDEAVRRVTRQRPPW